MVEEEKEEMRWLEKIYEMMMVVDHEMDFMMR